MQQHWRRSGKIKDGVKLRNHQNLWFSEFHPPWMLMYFFAGFFLFSPKLRVLVLSFPDFTYTSNVWCACVNWNTGSGFQIHSLASSIAIHGWFIIAVCLLVSKSVCDCWGGKPNFSHPHSNFAFWLFCQTIFIFMLISIYSSVPLPPPLYKYSFDVVKISISSLPD